MATFRNTMPANGIKAPHFQKDATRAHRPVSFAFTAFERLCEALGEACAAEERRLDRMSWDMAFGDPDGDAEDAVNAALEAAREAGEAPVVLVSDRSLIFAARFINCALGIENGPDRENVVHFLDASRALWNNAHGGANAQLGSGLVERAIDRVSRLTELLYGASEGNDTILSAF